MTTRSILMATLLVAATPSAARAQPQLEIGASLINGVIDVGENGGAIIGVPSGGFGVLVNPGLYASFFVTDHVAIEPQVGLAWASFDNGSTYIVNFVGQVDYFIRDTSEASPYVFVAGGVVGVSHASYTPKSVTAGVGYRMPMGDRLVFRFDVDYSHLTDEFEDADAVTFTLSIGGVLGQR